MKTLEDYISLKHAAPDHRISYGKHSEQFGELYLPKENNLHPTIIMIHGGCWQARYNLTVLGQLSKALTKIGYAVWNIEFRRLGNGGGFPITFEDVAMGADFLNTIAKKYALDLNSLTAMGHSAGGHLALWLAGRHHLSRSSKFHSNSAIKLERVISLAGIPDLVAGVEQDICRGACLNLMGGLPNKIPEQYQLASPHHLLPLNIPHWHLVGEHDPLVPVSYLEPFIQRAKQQDTHVHFEVIPEIGHFEMVMPNTVSWNYIKEALQ